jgi:hypothetical protein
VDPGVMKAYRNAIERQRLALGVKPHRHGRARPKLPGHATFIYPRHATT